MKPFPPIPRVVEGIAGPMRVDRPVNLPDREFGLFEFETRRIVVKATLPRDVAWSTLFHEMTHAALWDSGTHHLFTERQREAVCDAVAVARLAELRRSLGG